MKRRNFLKAAFGAVASLVIIPKVTVFMPAPKAAAVPDVVSGGGFLFADLPLLRKGFVEIKWNPKVFSQELLARFQEEVAFRGSQNMYFEDQVDYALMTDRVKVGVRYGIQGRQTRTCGLERKLGGRQCF